MKNIYYHHIFKYGGGLLFFMVIAFSVGYVFGIAKGIDLCIDNIAGGLRILGIELKSLIDVELLKSVIRSADLQLANSHWG